MHGIVFTASQEFLAEAMAEIKERFPDYRQFSLTDGVFFVEMDGQAKHIRDALLRQPAVFVHHMHLADRAQVQGFDEIMETVLERLNTDLQQVDGEAAVATQARAFATRFGFTARGLKVACDALLEERGCRSVIKDPVWVISVTVCGDMLYYGLDRAAYNLSDWTGGMIHFRKDASDISRAKFKLLEALIRFQPSLPSQGRALDLGAAPGGWTSVLLERGMQVLAVDTGDLDPRLLKAPGLEFRKQNVNDLRLRPGEQFDLITCDMSWSPFFTVDMINRLSKYLKVRGQAIVTVKLMGRKARTTLSKVLQEFDDSLRVLHVQHLFHNRREVTVHLERN